MTQDMPSRLKTALWILGYGIGGYVTGVSEPVDTFVFLVLTCICGYVAVWRVLNK